MAFDLTSVLGQATEVAERQQSSNENQLRLIYPGMGTLSVKLLYNPKSNLVARQIRRHTVGNSKYTCLGMYNMDCPICKTLESIKNATNQDLWKFNSKFRGLTYAQYVSSQGYTWTSENPEPKVGELIILMYPWTVYQDINRLISTAGAHANEVIASNRGKIINISRWMESSQVKYKAEFNGFEEFTSFNQEDGEAKFEEFLNNLPDLNEEIVPSTPNDYVMKGVRDASETLSREYLVGTGYNGMSPQMNTPTMSGTSQIITAADGKQYALVNGQYVPIASSVPPAVNPPQVGAVSPMNPPQQAAPQQIQMPHEMIESAPNIMNPSQSNPIPVASNADGSMMPNCFGKHVDQDPKCLSCPHELQCMTMV